MNAIVTVIGRDRVGIIAAVCGKLAELNVNILDITQTILKGNFTMVMSVDAGKANVEFDQLATALEKLGEQMSLSIRIQREDIFNAIKINSADLYHKVCRGYLYENRDEEVLYQGYKSAFYILQVVYYLRSNTYIDTKRELVYSLDGEDKEILLVILNWNSLDVLDNVDFYFEKLMASNAFKFSKGFKDEFVSDAVSVAVRDGHAYFSVFHNNKK